MPNLFPIIREIHADGCILLFNVDVAQVHNTCAGINRQSKGAPFRLRARVMDPRVAGELRHLYPNTARHLLPRDMIVWIE